MTWSDHLQPIIYVALKCPVSAQTTAAEAERHINADATLSIKCGAPHFMREFRSYGSVWGMTSIEHPYRDFAVNNFKQATLSISYILVALGQLSSLLHCHSIQEELESRG